MAEMRAKMILDLVANASGAKAARQGLKDIKIEARELDRTPAGQRIARDILSIASSSKGAVRGLREVKASATGLGGDGGSARLARDLDAARVAAAKLRAELRALRGASPAQPVRGAAPVSKDGDDGAVVPGTRALVGGYLGMQGARAGVRATVGQSVSFEKAMADVVKKVDLPEGQTQGNLERMITGSAIQFGRSREQIAALAAELGAAGVGYTDLGRAIAQATRASVAWDMTPAETGESLAKIRTQHQMSFDQLDEFIDKVNALADTGASKERDIVEMFQRAAAGAKVADVDRDTSLAFMSAMSAGGMQPEIAARGFGAMVSKLRTAQTGANKKLAEGLEMLNLTPAGVEKGMKTDGLATLLDLMNRFSQSSDKAAVAVKMFGQEWWDEFARMVEGAPEIAKNLRLLGDAGKWKGSSEKSLNIELATTANHLERLSALASDVGDRLGRWALPPLNEAIERIIKGLDLLDARDAQRKAETEAGQKIANDVPLSAEERRRMVEDKVFADRASVTARDIKEGRRDKAESEVRTALERDKNDEGMDRMQGVRLRNLARIKLDREIEEATASLKLRDPTGRDAMLLGERRKLESRRRRRSEMGGPEAISTTPLISRSDEQEMRARLPRSEVMRLRDELGRSERRLAAIETLRGTANRADKPGYAADAAKAQERLRETRRSLAGIIAPQAIAAGRFGFGPGGAPAIAAPAGPTGSGLSSFGLRGGGDVQPPAPGPGKPAFKSAAGAASSPAVNPGAAWAQSLRDAFEIDLGGAGLTLMERFRGGIEAGGAGAAAAATGVGQDVKTSLSGIDASGAAAATMSGYAAAITAHGASAVAAAQAVGQRVKQALTVTGSASIEPASAGRRAISGALHDGVV